MSTAMIVSIVVILAVIIGLLFAVMFTYYYLLKRIARHFPAYYKKLGAPFLPSADRSITKTINRDGANYRFLWRLIRGTAGDLPADNQLRRQARVVQLEIRLLIVLVVIGIGTCFV